MAKYNVLDLFCGAGGLSLGFKLAGFNIVGGVDFMEDAIATHEKNFKNSISICGDITKIDDNKVIELFGSKNVDVIIGGPPCQGFSAGNRQQIENDPRNKLFFEFIRFVRLLKPKAIVIENVRQILTKDNGFAKNKIFEILEELNYNVDVRVLTASDYGVPQKRNRAIFIGIRKDIGRVNYDKIKKSKNIITVKEAIGELYELENSTNMVLSKKPKTEFQKYLRSKDNTVKNHEPKYPNKGVQERMSYVPQGGNWQDVPEHLWKVQRNNRHSSAYKRLSENEPSITIDTGHMNYFHPIFNRVPTVRESARLQSFPDDFEFVGTTTSQLRQVGNAVPPLMAKAIANLVLKTLDGTNSDNTDQSKKIIDLFCGCGGFSKGFENAGYTVELAIDSWNDAIETFNINHKKRSGVTKNIYDYTNEEIKQFGEDHNIIGIIGGPPCQGFSMVGKREVNDARNTLYLQYVRFVEQIKPEFFILENVKGLLTLEKGYFKEEIINRFSKLGYNVTYKVLRASDYGVPQNRERVFFVGLRKDTFKDKYFVYPLPVKHIVGTKEALSDLPSLDNNENETKYKTEPQNDFQKLMRKNSNYIKNNEITVHTEQTKNIIAMIPDGGNIKSLPEEYYKVRNYGSAFKRMNSKLPSTTIDCGHRNYFHYKENRIPTVRESARIQSFPDDFEFLGTKTSQYTQVGNAVPVLLAEAVANSMNKMYEKE